MRNSIYLSCSKDVLRITDGMGKNDFCGNKTGRNHLVTGDQVEIIFHSDGKIERRGYLLNFTLVSSPSVSSGKWDHKEADRTTGGPDVVCDLHT